MHTRRAALSSDRRRRRLLLREDEARGQPRPHRRPPLPPLPPITRRPHPAALSRPRCHPPHWCPDLRRESRRSPMRSRRQQQRQQPRRAAAAAAQRRDCIRSITRMSVQMRRHKRRLVDSTGVLLISFVWLFFGSSLRAACAWSCLPVKFSSAAKATCSAKPATGRSYTARSRSAPSAA